MLRDWRPRSTSADLAARYRAEGYWTNETLASVVDTALRAHPELTLRVWSDARPFVGTVGQVHDQALRLAAGLRKLGVGRGDVVAFQLPNWAEAAAAFWGIAYTGAVLVPIVPFYGRREVSFIVRQSGAKVFLTADRFRHVDYLATVEALRSEAHDLEYVIVVGETGAGMLRFDDVTGGSPDPQLPNVGPDDPVIIAYTSGTTAAPKGVVHTHQSILAETRQLAAIQAKQDLPMLTGAPIGHFIGMLTGLLMPVARSHPIHLTDVWDPGRVLQAVAEGNLTAGGGSAYFLSSLLDHPDFGSQHLERIRYVGLGGSPIPAALAERAERLGISVFCSYGCSEQPSITGSTHDDPREKRLYTNGSPLPGVEMRLVDENGRDVAQGEAGEIVSRGPELFAGYTDAALTDESFQEGGWYATGDIGVLDEHGWLIITDRKKDIIIRGGENVSAREIEEILAQMPEVGEVAVVAAPDPRLGEHGCAFIRPKPGATAPDLARVRACLEEAGLTRQKWPEEVREVADFPRTPSGKVKKFVLRDQLRTESGRS